ncbi:MAG: winged helix-turn-helix transcriptional regulator [Acidimicrobiia bacterium]
MIVAHYPEACSESLADGLALAGDGVVAITELDAADARLGEADLVVVELGEQPMRRLREVTRIGDQLGLPVLVVATPDQVVLMEGVAGISDFMVSPIHPPELRLRVGRLTRKVAGDELLRFKDLELNPLNYQATLAGKPVDLTYMEYELLRFLVENPVRVWSREQLLSRVWGYEYYGGARTVDVHVRRLRAKLGEERSSWITTVRSVGYRFG